jgi:hypothetical protein
VVYMLPDSAGAVDRRTGEVWRAIGDHGIVTGERVEGSACYRPALERREQEQAERD